MKQHILEHWIKLAQEIQEGLHKEFMEVRHYDEDAAISLYDCTSDARILLGSLNAIKQHYSDLNT
jgi:hypothetical protein